MTEPTTPKPAAPTCARVQKSRREGFTLIEIMAVVVIMGMLMGMVGLGVLIQLNKARKTTAKAKISQLESALEFYKMDNYRYPPSLEGLVNRPPEAKNFPPGGYIQKADALMDPWEERFIYINPGAKNPHSVDIFSAGPDGVAGNEDDITNWDGALPADG